jgi:hypothetical protein
VLAVAPGFGDVVVVDERVVDFAVVDVGAVDFGAVVVDDRVVDVGTEVVARGRVLVVVRATVGVGPAGSITFVDTGSGRTSR